MKAVRLQREDLLFLAVCVLLILLAYGLRLWLLRVRAFDADEFEHLHAAWLFAGGYLPYRDFFEHHTPALYFLLTPVFRAFHPEADMAQTLATMLWSRRLMWLLTGGILLLTFWLGARWREWRTGLLGTVFLGNTIMFFHKTLEVRPDVLATASWLACLLAVVGGIQQETPGRRSRWLFFWSGVWLGLALLATQKMLLALPGWALAMTWYLLDRRTGGTFSARCGNIGSQVAGLAIPLVLTLGYFAWRHGLAEFVEFNLLWNLRWKTRFPPYEPLKDLLLDNPDLVGLGLAGLAHTGWGMFRRASVRRGEFVPVVNAVGLMAGLFLLPVPQRQYFLVFLPLLALFAAGAVVAAAEFVTDLPRREVLARYRLWIMDGVSALVLVTGAVLWYSHVARNRRVDFCAHGAAAALALALGLFLISLNRRGLALTALALLLSVGPVRHMRGFFSWSNRPQLAVIEYVLEHTTPQDSVMDGWGGVGVFRPHAYFYWMLHREVRAMIDAEQTQQLLDDLRCGKVAPALINLDADVRGISPEIAAFIEENYEPAHVGQLRARRPPEVTPAPDHGPPLISID